LHPFQPRAYPELMLTRSRLFLLGLLALLGLTALTIDPIAARAFHDRPPPQEMKIVGTPNGSHYCVIANACDTATPSAMGMAQLQNSAPLVLTGLTLAIALAAATPLSPSVLRIASPPPRYLAA
jgi:hypothetical protein